jgi:hypothetical protein
MDMRFVGVVNNVDFNRHILGGGQSSPLTVCMPIVLQNVLPFLAEIFIIYNCPLTFRMSFLSIYKFI